MRPFVHCITLEIRGGVMKRHVSIPVFFLSIVLAVLIGFGINTGLSLWHTQSSVLEEAKSEIETKFIGEYDETELKDAAVEGMVNALGDQWSYYLSADEYADYEASINNSYVGIGITIELEMDQGGMKIRKVQKGSAAEQGGIKAGEWIVAANGISFESMTLEEAKSLLSGEEGTKVEVTVRNQDGQEREVTLEYRKVVTIPVQYQMLEGQVGYIKIINFDNTASQYAKEAVTDLMEQGAEKLVFDVRNNPGGLLTELLDLLDFLLPEGETFVSVDYTGQETVYRSDEGCVDLPIAILVNEESYSAAEFFAAIFQEMGRGIVIGTQTCGKGYSQVPIRLSDGSAIVLSTAKYFTPNRVSLIGVGVTPDVVQTMTEEEKEALINETLPVEEDQPLQVAIEKLRSEP